MTHISDTELNALLTASLGERVTPDYIKSRIKAVAYHRPVGTLTICTIELDNGFTVTGESACIDPVNYRQDIGEKIAYDGAFEKLWPLFGFLLAERRLIRSSTAGKAG